MGRPRIAPAARIEKHTVRTSDGCLEWTGGLTRDGYGKVTVPRDGDDWSKGLRTVHAHRLAWELIHGPTEYPLDHVCRNRRCCEVSHLREATPRANTFASGSTAPAAINAQKTHCIRGHPLRGDNLMVYLSRGRVARACRQCRRDRDNEYQRRNRAGRNGLPDHHPDTS
jgi:hypothetical protein